MRPRRVATALVLLLAAGLWLPSADRGAMSPSPARAESAAAGPTTQPAAPAVAVPASQPDLAAETQRLRDQWLTRLGAGHAADVAGPFVVIIKGPETLARQWMERTVAPAADRLQRQYMKARPDRAVVILLFPDQRTYRDACRRRLGVAAPAYFGFFQPSRRLLVMDISTGGGTLVHELTHVMIAFDFPRIPAWFNEGMGSLYEQCRIEADRLRGLENWRLPALQKAIAADTLDSLERLTQKDFLGADVGLNYAHARYLCMYLQERGLLAGFYTAFRDGFDADPTGLKFLRQTLAPRPLDEVDKQWRQWVQTLRFPPRGR